MGFNPSKGGYIYRFSGAVLIFADLLFLGLHHKHQLQKSLILWGVLMSYQVFIDKGRTELVSGEQRQCSYVYNP